MIIIASTKVVVNIRRKLTRKAMLKIYIENIFIFIYNNIIFEKLNITNAIVPRII